MNQNNPLPVHESLPVELLASCFDDLTMSYKFYWFLSILDHLKQEGTAFISYREITERMFSYVWYPRNYYRLSFGHKDGFKKIADFISEKTVIDNRPSAAPLIEQIENKLTGENLKEFNKQLSNLKRYVPYRFQRPFFPNLKGEKDPEIKALANEYFDNGHTKVIYRYVDKGIELDAEWIEYFNRHQGVLRGFIHWHLVNFVQKFNPNVIGLSNKLERPKQRDLNLAKAFWQTILTAEPQLECIYTGQSIEPDFSVDHFVPWSYVTHDELWNLTPAPKPVNSSKSDSLPDLDAYLKPFAIQQHFAFNTILDANIQKEKKANMLESYNRLFRLDPKEISQLPAEKFCERLEETLNTLCRTARSMGFTADWNLKERMAKGVEEELLEELRGL